MSNSSQAPRRREYLNIPYGLRQETAFMEIQTIVNKLIDRVGELEDAAKAKQLVASSSSPSYRYTSSPSTIVICDCDYADYTGLPHSKGCPRGQP